MNVQSFLSTWFLDGLYVKSISWTIQFSLLRFFKFILFQTKQVGEVLRALNTNPTEGEVKRLVQDQKPDSRISFETFLPILQAVSAKKLTDTVEDFIEGMRHFDKDGNGFITSAELRHLLTNLGEKMSEEDVENLIHGQEDSSGNVNYEQFVRMVLAS